MIPSVFTRPADAPPEPCFPMPLSHASFPSPRRLAVSFSFTAVLLGAVALTACPSLVRADTVGHWRFEPRAFLADSGPDGLRLSAPGAKGMAIEEALRPTGPGAAFPRLIAGEPNRGAATGHHAFDYTFLERHFSADVSGRADKLSGQLSIEALVHLSRSSADSMVIVGQGVQAEDGAGWALVVTSEKNNRVGPLRVLLQFSRAGKAWASEDLTMAVSDLSLEIGKDYYLAVTADFADPTQGGITVYLKDLTEGSPLRTDHLKHSAKFTRMAGGRSPLTIGGDHRGKLPWFGLIDEVRLSSKKLSAAELLINQAQTK